MSSPPDPPSAIAKPRQHSAPPLQKPLPPSPPLSHSSHSSRTSSPLPAAAPGASSPRRSRSPLSAYETVLGNLHLRYAGLCSKEGPNRAWQEFRLSRLEFQRLYQQHLDPDLSKAGSGFAHWCAHKLRWDYDSDREIFVVRMPEAIHEVLIERVARAIQEGKEELQRTWAQEQCDASEGGKKTAAAAELQRVDSTRNTTFTLPGESDEEDRDQKRSPDGSFAHEDAKYPSLILEVAYSQSDKSLKRLARDYIHLSECHIACVVGVHLAYNEPGKGDILDPERDQTAKFSIWRAALDDEKYGYCKAVCEDICFRKADGTIVSEAPPLELTISDILPSSVFDASDCLDSDRTASVALITPTQLGEFLGAAERHHRSRKQAHSRSAGLLGQKGMRKRSRTPEEELSDSREAKYQRQEDAASNHEVRQDSSYSGRHDASIALPVPRRRSSRRVQGRESSQ